MKQKKIKVLLIFGTRPEAIKLAPVILQLQKLKNEFDLKVCITGQHKEMLDQALNFFSIVPDYNLNIMRKKQDLFDVTSSVILGVKKIIIKENPKIVLVHGDTTTTFASALAAFYLNVKVGHIEAGLRTYDIKQPFPEEFNRQITSKLSHWHFAPTTKSKQNLLNENVNSDKIVVTGNTVIDTLFLVKNKIESTPKIKKSILVTLKTKLNFNISNSKYRPDLVIGFAAETDDLLANARLKLKNKGCDWIVANRVNAESLHMGGEENEVIIIKKNEEINLARQSKATIAKFICEKIVEEVSA